MTLNSSLPAVILTTLAVMALVTAVPGSAVADSGYQITASESTDTPTREVTLQGATYEISALGKANLDGSINLKITAPEDNQFYRVYLYNSSQKIIMRDSGTGDATLSFDLNGREPGTYMFALQEQGTTQKIYPLVIQGYTVNLDTPDQVTAGDSFTADISLTQTDVNSPPDRVEVVVAGQNSQITESASTDGSSYTATISTDPLSDGTYLVYANARGTNTVYNEQEILGVSGTKQVTVGTSASDDDSTTDAEATEDNSTTDTETAENDNQNTSSEPSGEIQDPEAAEELPEVEASNENTQSESESPGGNGQSNTSSQSDSSSTIPGFTLELVILSLILTAVLLSSRE